MKYGRIVRNIALIVASGSIVPVLALRAADPPPGLLKQIAQRETGNAQARENYTYRQSVTIQEFDDQGRITGQYREVRDITFSPSRVRYEQVVDPAKSTLTRIKLTPEDFADLRNVQPFLLTMDNLALYEGQYKGEETMDGQQCFVEYIRPKQILSKQRFFEGTLWVRESDLAVVRSMSTTDAEHTTATALPQLSPWPALDLPPRRALVWLQGVARSTQPRHFPWIRRRRLPPRS